MSATNHPSGLAVVTQPEGERGRWALGRIGRARLLFRVGAVSLLILLYYSLDWIWLRGIFGAAVASALGYLGHHPISLDAGGAPSLLLKGQPFAITAGCTYADLLFILMPLTWRFRLALATNLLRVAFTALSVFALNLVRVVLALHAYTLGADWTMVHDVPDILIHFSSVLVALLLAVRNDR